MNTTVTTSTNENIEIQVLQTILMNLVTVPQDIKITKNVDEQGVLLSVIVNPQDMGIIIGRNGSMAMSLKSIMRAVGKLHKKTLRLQFLEPDGSTTYAGTFDASKPKPSFGRNSNPSYQDKRPNYNSGYAPQKEYSQGYQQGYNNPVYPPAPEMPQQPKITPVSNGLPKDDLDDFMLN